MILGSQWFASIEGTEWYRRPDMLDSSRHFTKRMQPATGPAGPGHRGLCISKPRQGCRWAKSQSFLFQDCHCCMLVLSVNRGARGLRRWKKMHGSIRKGVSPFG